MVFGALFLILLARCVGPGSAVLLALLGGAAGNALTVPLRPGAFTSLGFSSALFAAIGGLAGAMARRERHWRKAMLPWLLERPCWPCWGRKEKIRTI